MFYMMFEEYDYDLMAGGRGGRVILLCMGYIAVYCPKGYGYLAILVGSIDFGLICLYRVWLHSSLELGKCVFKRSYPFY